MNLVLTETQARLLADQMTRLLHKARAAGPPLSNIYDFAVRTMAGAAGRCGVNYVVGGSGVTWDAKKREASEAAGTHNPEQEGSTPSPATTSEEVV